VAFAAKVMAKHTGHGIKAASERAVLVIKNL
jgi:hypothetical protein